MGLDLALAGLVLLLAIRGWLKGFVVQAIRLVGLVSSVYVAVPLRDQVKPYVVSHLASMRPELIDRLLWWASAVISYFVLVGVASLLVAVSRKQTMGMSDPRRGDQFAGFGLGLIKGLIVSAFLVAAVHKYAEAQIAKLTWAQEQVKTSKAWAWNEQYHPAARIWSTPPVQKFVGHIQKMGLNGTPPKEEPAAEPEADKTVQTASRTPHLAVPSASFTPHRARRPKLNLKASRQPSSASNPPSGAPELDTQGLDPELSKAIESIKSQLQNLESPD